MTNRNVGLDCLKIIAMMIVIHHSLGHTGIKEISLHSAASAVPVWLLAALCLSAVNVYVLISGYFLSESDGFCFKKILKLWSQVFFYSLSFEVIFVALGLKEFSLKSLLLSLIPFSSNKYWFFTNYVVLYCLSPFINIMTKAMNKDQHKRICMLLFIFTVVLPNVLFTLDPLGVNYGYSLLWFIFLYLIASYIRKYNVEITFIKAIGLYLSLSLVVCMSKIGITVVTQRIIGEEVGSGIFTYYSSIVVFAASVCLFLAFKNLRIPKKAFISYFASLTFGIYLIHDNENVRSLLWNGIFRGEGDINILFFVCKVLAAVFIPCLAIEAVRKYFGDRLVEKIYQAKDKRNARIS